MKLCVGSLAISPILRNVSPREAFDIINACAENGADILDTAEYYRNYALLAPSLAALPRMRVITKTYAYDERGARASLDKARAELGRDFIDYFLLHEQESEHTLHGHACAIEFFQKAKRNGIIGRFGISTHRIACVRAAVLYREKYGIDVIMAPLNVAGMGLSDGSIEDMIAALQAAAAAGVEIYLMKALGGGHLISRREEALSFILAQDYAAYAALGVASVAEARYNCAVLSGRIPDHCDARDSLSANRRLIIEAGCVGCGKCAARCGQGALAMRGGVAVADSAKCVRCGYCAQVCPELVIKVI